VTAALFAIPTGLVVFALRRLFRDRQLGGGQVYRLVFAQFK
jgi:hypothetical protein